MISNKIISRDLGREGRKSKELSHEQPSRRQILARSFTYSNSSEYNKYNSGSQKIDIYISKLKYEQCLKTIQQPSRSITNLQYATKDLQ
ncbi:hypothetical protein GIB67_023669 [Kingdonia uniflora]|uniref:Uncharacterized protein n=1 Tax=Kingdonia uniflora TaxID=39325 RepID=A0A7J7MGE7_9MAGN|nr:hypothetical protein GIB67_023669 [Kingdonia uniflora]